MTGLAELSRIAELEFADCVTQSEELGAKVRLFLCDGSYVDVCHWERRHIDGCIYRLDNFPDTNWRQVASFPLHFHDGAQDRVVASPLPDDAEAAFRGFMRFVQAAIARESTGRA